MTTAAEPLPRHRGSLTTRAWAFVRHHTLTFFGILALAYLMLPIRLVSVTRVVSVPVTCLARSIAKPIGAALGMALVLEWCRSWLLVGLPALAWLPLAVALGVSTYLALLAVSQRELFLRLMSQVRSHAP